MADRDIHIPFNTGFDDFTDDRWKPDGHISTITNAVWNQEGRLQKRGGFESFVPLVNVGGLSQFGDTYVTIAPQGVAIFNPQQGTLTPTRVGLFLDARTYPATGVMDTGAPQVSIAYSSGVYMAAWARASDGALFACFFDAESKRPLTESYEVNPDPHVDVVAHAFNGFFAIVATYSDTTSQRIYRNPTVYPVHDNWTTESLGPTWDTQMGIDSYAEDDTIYIVGHPDADDLNVLVSTYSIQNTGLIATATIPWTLGFCRSWFINRINDTYYTASVINGTNALVGWGFDAALTVDVPEIALTAASSIDKVTVGPTGNATMPVAFTYTISPAGAAPSVQIKMYSLDLLVTTYTRLSGFCYPRAAPFVDPISDDVLFGVMRVDDPLNSDIQEAFTSNGIAFLTQSEIDPTLSLDTQKIGLKCRFGPIGLEKEASISTRPYRVTAVTDTKFAVAETFKTNTTPPSYDIRITELETDNTDVARGQELAGALYTNRGPCVYDGQFATEVGFFGQPSQAVAPVFTPGATGLTPGGDYIYGYCWEVTNALGDTYRGTPTLTPTIAATDEVATIVLGGLPPSNWGVRFDKGTDPYVVAYRSEDAGTTLYRTLSQQFQDYDAYSPTVIDATPDTTIVSHPIIYTDGAQLPPVENVLPPCFVDICVYKNRLVGVADDGVTLWISTEKRADEALRFNDALNIQVLDGGRINAITAESNRMIVFKNKDIFAIYGEGGDERGVGSNFGFPAQLAQNIGCTRPQSVVTTPYGTFFQGGPGIMRIAEQSVDFVGNQIKDTFLGNVSAAAHSAEQLKVFFACHNDDLDEFNIMVFDYRFNRWTKWTYTHPNGLTGENLKILGMVVYDGRLHCSLGDRATIIRQKESSSSSSHLDFTNTWVTMSVEFAPIKTSGPQGFQHVKKVMVVGEQASRHALSVSFAENYQSTYYQTVNWAAATIDTWATLPIEQFSAKPARPRCEAIKIKIEDAAPSTGVPGTGAGIELVGVSLTVAQKQNLMRLGPSYKR